jgi:alanine dehydrogenase
MKIGVPREIKADERRVGATPAGVRAMGANGHQVLVERGAGTGSGFSDQEYAQAGAEILDAAADVWAGADLVVKVKEPVAAEYEFMRAGQMLFTYLHLAANRDLTDVLVQKQVVGIGYETVQLPDGSLPLLAPMSEVAGRLSVQVGARCLEAASGGMGILLSGVSGVRPARVTILGGGIAGLAAAVVAVGMKAQVAILDVNPARLRYIEDLLGDRLVTIMSNPANIEAECLNSHLVIGSVLIPGARAPKLVSRDLVRRMTPGSALVDIAVDQGGCAETTRPTTHHEPMYLEEGVVHYAVSNMPGAVPRTSTIALTNVTLAYALSLADLGWQKAMARDPALAKGLNCQGGEITCQPVADAFELSCRPVKF